MDDLPIQSIRETNRNNLVLNRRKNRDEETDIRRSVKELVNPDTVLTIANKLKTQASVSLPELQVLKNALIDDAAHIETVLTTNGALRGLVRELTGQDVNKQCAAAGCCCNLALGDARAGVAVAKAAGPYLVSTLDSLTTEMAVTSAWTLGNLAMSGKNACELLIAQGAIAKLIDWLNNSNEEIRDSAIYALERFAHELKDNLSMEYLQKIFEILPNIEITNTLQLLFILSCHNDFSSSLVHETLLIKLLQYLASGMQGIDEDIIHLFRFLANLNSKELYEVILKYMLDNNMMNTVLSYSETKEPVLWFLSNACNLCSDNPFFEKLFAT